MVFISPRFLFPVDSGGKIRTTQILKGLLGGRFHVTLVSPAPATTGREMERQIGEVCDRFVSWTAATRGALFKLWRMRLITNRLPIPVATDRSPEGTRAIERELRDDPDVTVFDFLHSAVLRPGRLETPSVLFTHNVETEIFERHRTVAANRLLKAIWTDQAAKMERFERETLRRFDRIVAVSERDRRTFAERFEVTDRVALISTGVDLDRCRYVAPGAEPRIVFTGAMDWMPNVDGIEYFLRDIWPLVLRDRENASLTVVGRCPPRSLVDGYSRPEWRCRFTGFVEDVRPFVHAAGIYIIPLRVGGGTRLKVFEAMALGAPIVSTSVGVEGLPVEDGVHYLRADDPEEFRAAIRRLLDDGALRSRLSRNARAYVEENCSHRIAARQFEDICMEAAERRSAAA